MADRKVYMLAMWIATFSSARRALEFAGLPKAGHAVAIDSIESIGQATFRAVTTPAILRDDRHLRRVQYRRLPAKLHDDGAELVVVSRRALGADVDVFIGSGMHATCDRAHAEARVERLQAPGARPWTVVVVEAVS